MQRFTKGQFDKMFPTDDSCLEFLKNARWPSGITCAKCQTVTKHYRIRAKKAYACEFCGTATSPTADTIFHKSPTPLRSWYYAMFLLANTRMGISAKHLERELGVTYKCAWRMFHQIRKLTANDASNLFGQIEIDETYIGGKRPGKPGRGAAGKTIAVGMVERGGRAIVEITPNVQARTLLPIITEHIPTADGTVIYTDEMPSYNRLGNMGFSHETVNHAAKEYVNGEAHTQTVDGLWSIVKNGITGSNRHVGPQHLQSYLDAYVFRYNHRDDETPMFQTLMGQVPQRLS